MCHALKRYYERYGENLDRAQYWALCDLARQGKSILQKKQTSSRTMHVFKVGSRHIVAIYSKSTKRIVTFLSPEMIRKELILAATRV